MGLSVQVRIPRDSDAYVLAATMRTEDAAEVLASGGYDPLTAVDDSLRHSDVSYALEIEGQLVAMWGVMAAPGQTLLGGHFGIVWALTSKAVEHHPLTFARLSRVMLLRLLGHYPVLVNAVDARYETALRWATWLGATVGPPIPFGRNGEPFHLITFRRTS